MGGNAAGIFTELAILYVKYNESKLMDHLRQFFARMNIPRVIRECERYENWSALCFLYVQNDEADNAALTMINHAADAWEHTEFKSVLQRCANPENLYKAVQFYVEEHPLELNDLLVSLSKKEGVLDHSRVVVIMKRRLPLIKEYLEQVGCQPLSIPASSPSVCCPRFGRPCRQARPTAGCTAGPDAGHPAL